MKKILTAFLSLCLVFALSNSAEASSPKISRVQGKNRSETALEISKFIKNQDKVIAAREDDFADALSGSSLPGDYPILLVNSKTTSPEVLNRIKEMAPKEIILLGGEASISNQQEREFAGISSVEKVTRLAGSNRYETSLAIGKYAGHKDFILAGGKNFPDALSASAYSKIKSMGILLSPTEGLTTNSLDYLSSLDESSAILVGGKTILTDRVENQLKEISPHVSRISGSNRYATAVKMGELFPQKKILFIASGESFPDALAGSSFARQVNAPILLTRGESLPPQTKAFIEKVQPEEIILLGGPGAVSKGVEGELKWIFSDGTIEIPGPFVSQRYPVVVEYGCEAAASLMALQRKGYATDQSLVPFAENMPKASADPYKGFVGSLYQTQPNKYQGIYPSAMAPYMARFGKIKNISGQDFSVLREEVQKGNTISFWATLDFQNPRYFNYWNGSRTVRGIMNAHSVTIIGYDSHKKLYKIADPYNPQAPSKPRYYDVSEARVQEIYNLNKFAIAVE